MFDPIDNTPKVVIQEEKDMTDVIDLMSRYEDLFKQKLKQTRP